MIHCPEVSHFSWIYDLLSDIGPPLVLGYIALTQGRLALLELGTLTQIQTSFSGG